MRTLSLKDAFSKSRCYLKCLALYSCGFWAVVRINQIMPGCSPAHSPSAKPLPTAPVQGSPGTGEVWTECHSDRDQGPWLRQTACLSKAGGLELDFARDTPDFQILGTPGCLEFSGIHRMPETRSKWLPQSHFTGAWGRHWPLPSRVTDRLLWASAPPL